MKLNLSSIISEATSPKIVETNNTHNIGHEKFAGELDELSSRLNVLETLAKVACYQNDLDISLLSKEDEVTLEKIAAKLPHSQTSTTDLIKKAAEFVRTYSNFTQKVEIEKKAEKLATQLVNSGLISAEEVIPKLAELKLKSSEDLTILEKALEFHKQSEFLSMGKLSDSKVSGSQSAADQFLNELINI